MKNSPRREICFQIVSSRGPVRCASRLSPIWGSLLLSLVVGLSPASAHAQSPKNSPLRIANVSTQDAGEGTTISISADGSLSRAQTWQDGDGYHVVVPYASAQNTIKPSRGVKVRRLGQSLEILVQIRPGSSVAARVDDNRLNLSISGKLEPRAETVTENSQRVVEENWAAAAISKPATDDSIAKPAPAPERTSSFTSQFPSSSSLSTTKAGPPSLQPRPNLQLEQVEGPVTVAPEADIQLRPEEEGLAGSIFSSTSVIVVIVLGIIGLVVSRKLRSRQPRPKTKASARRDRPAADESVSGALPTPQPVPERASLERRSRAATAHAVANSSSGAHMVVATPDSLYGAYRIEQEVGKLVLGQPHRMDVLSSRAPDDRRAIEASLIKMIASSPDERERNRAAEALEEYGFVARDCATLLMAPDAFDRTTAARALGEIKSPAALPFLLEGLYDTESIVRNQAVASIGELKVPRAIGALLDMARRHPDVPGNLVSKALSACSVEGLDFFDAPAPEPAMLGDGGFEGFGCDIASLEPAAIIEDLPADSDDEGLVQALLEIQSENVSQRLEAAKELARYQVKSAIDVLMTIARLDADSSVRSQAISSLASINHDSVFPAVLIGMADESREVRAAAARSLSHLSFDRSDAYIRVLETNDEVLLPEVARACIKAGIVSQGIDRLVSGDRRQAYETFSIISILARAKLFQPMLDVIANHSKLDVRLATLRLLTNTGEPEVFEQLRELAMREDLGEELRTALLEAMYKLDQSSAGSNTELPPELPSFTTELVFESNEATGGETGLTSDLLAEAQSQFGEFEL